MNKCKRGLNARFQNMTWKSKPRMDRKRIKHRQTKKQFPKILDGKCRLR